MELGFCRSLFSFSVFEIVIPQLNKNISKFRYHHDGSKSIDGPKENVMTQFQQTLQQADNELQPFTHIQGVQDAITELQTLGLVTDQNDIDQCLAKLREGSGLLMRYYDNSYYDQPDENGNVLNDAVYNVLIALTEHFPKNDYDDEDTNASGFIDPIRYEPIDKANHISLTTGYQYDLKSLRQSIEVENYSYRDPLTRKKLSNRDIKAINLEASVTDHTNGYDHARQNDSDHNNVSVRRRRVHDVPDSHNSRARPLNRAGFAPTGNAYQLFHEPIGRYRSMPPMTTTDQRISDEHMTNTVNTSTNRPRSETQFNEQRRRHNNGRIDHKIHNLTPQLAMITGLFVGSITFLVTGGNMAAAIFSFAATATVTIFACSAVSFVCDCLSCGVNDVMTEQPPVNMTANSLQRDRFFNHSLNQPELNSMQSMMPGLEASWIDHSLDRGFYE